MSILPQQLTRRQAMQVRCLRPSQMDTVLRIEAENTGPRAWTPEEFEWCLRERNTIIRVVEHDEIVVGFVVYQLLEKSIDILKLAVGAAHRRTGVGSHIIDRLVRKLTAGGPERITAAVWDGNLGAQLFFRSCGFKAAEVLPDWEERGENAYLFELAPKTALPGGPGNLGAAHSSAAKPAYSAATRPSST